MYRKLICLSGLIGFSFIIVTIVFYLFYIKYLNHISTDITNNKILSELEFDVGWLQHSSKNSSYTNFSEKKPYNTIRIGCFGDSFTYGDEVNHQYDYPTLLQQILNSIEDNKYQVLNFGVSFHGFHQSHIMWDHLAGKYNVDYVILGPWSFQHERDSTFNHSYYESYLNGYPSSIHSRYILDGNNVQLKSVPGDTISEKIKDYWSFIPRFRYLRYDFESPIFLKALLTYLTPQKKLRNPFYYIDNIDNEMNSIYQILVNNIAQNSKQLFITNYHDNILKVLSNQQSQNINLRKVFRRDGFPYRAYGGHDSSLGNNLVAQQISDLLLNKKISKLKTIKSKEYTFYSISTKPEFEARQKLNNFDDVIISIDDQEIGNFLNTSRNETTPSTIKNVHSLIGFFKNTLVDSVYVNYDTSLDESMKLSLNIFNNGEKKSFILDKIKFIDTKYNIAYFDLGDYLYSRSSIHLIPEGNIVFKNINNQTYTFKKGDRLTISVGDKIILTSQIKDINEIPSFTPYNRDFFAIFPDGQKSINVNVLKDFGNYFLVLKTKSLDTYLKFGEWYKQKQLLRFNDNYGYIE